MDSYWVAFYKFCEDIGVKYEADSALKLNLHAEICQSCGWFYPFENQVLVCERPEVIQMKGDRLHCENGPSVKFRDGWAIYSLNGVLMSESQVMTPAEKMDAAMIMKETNVEVRRELIRKVGVERFIQAAGAKELDGPHRMKIGKLETEYSLLSVKLSDEIPDARFIKMMNPSIRIWHVEGVAPECSTVQEALNWRAGDIKAKWEPAVLT